MAVNRKSNLVKEKEIAFRYFRDPAPQRMSAREKERSRLGQWTTVIIPRIISVQRREEEEEENARTQTVRAACLHADWRGAFLKRRFALRSSPTF